MRILIIYYSRTGTTKQVAEKIQKSLNCEIEEIIDTKNRKGPIGYISAGRDATMKKLTRLKEAKYNPSEYDLIIIGTPIWSWNISTPIRTYLENNKNKFNKVAFFCTMGGSGSNRCFNEMEKIINKKSIASLALLTKEVKEKKYQEKLNEFTNKMK